MHELSETDLAIRPESERAVIGEAETNLNMSIAEQKTGHLVSYCVSHLPVALVRDNPAILDGSSEPWPGGMQHQLLTVGVVRRESPDEHGIPLG
ncbi:hypothetical protein [Micromonospora sp. NPDC048839]|uniref:hypothetical protein n=1 Tax=Micromonospora sp. NPDC048839 TaxID=3155641 RepID=UPI0034043E0C